MRLQRDLLIGRLTRVAVATVTHPLFARGDFMNRANGCTLLSKSKSLPLFRQISAGQSATWNGKNDSPVLYKSCVLSCESVRIICGIAYSTCRNHDNGTIIICLTRTVG